MWSGERFALFTDNWFMSVTMLVGSFIAGATSEGGGAVAFPVMTLAFGITPPVARDFSLLIQSVGMGSAALTILWTRIPVVLPAVVLASLGGAVGMVVGLEFVAPRVAPAYAKMLFTSLWLSFAFALFWINRYREREVLDHLPAFGPRPAALLIAYGVLGGVVSSITGSGLDIVTFSLLVLRFRVDETIATPTSVLLMAGNALVGALWRTQVQGGVAEATWGYWWVCVPIVVVGAPFGAWFIRGRSRHFVAGLLYTSILAQFVAAVWIVPQSGALLGFSAAVFGVGVLAFGRMAAQGVRRLAWLASRRA